MNISKIETIKNNRSLKIILLGFILLLCPAYLLADTPEAVPDNPAKSESPATPVVPLIHSAPDEVAQNPPASTPVEGGPERETTEGRMIVGDSGISESYDDEGPQIQDPFAPTNKVMFNFNDKLYFRVLKPVAQGYSRLPEDLRVIFSNIYDNLWAPSRILNNLMQLRLKAAGNELIRFAANTFIGVGGIGDAGKDVFGIHKQEADFGQTLGRYGLDHGFYLVLPLFGPSSLRDGVGLVGDRFMHPLTYVSSSDLTFWQAAGISAHEVVNDASFKIGDYESFKDAAIDPYVSMRDAFVQNRKKKVDESKHQ
ncbi:MAG: VacJ family lipoprotein [Nitrospirae bacterium]|nr:VacJ family lipoprotein [Nitrospirota bacterium]